MIAKAYQVDPLVSRARRSVTGPQEGSGSGYRTLPQEPRGVLQVSKSRRPFRAVRTRSALLRKAVDRAYRPKYDRPGDVPYTRDMTGAKSRATTTELVLG
jgi:hypothetical protein